MMATGKNAMQPSNLFDAAASQEIFNISREFEYKVSYDFKRFVFLAPNGGDIHLDSMLGNVVCTPGYEAHKIVFHLETASHIHVRYANEENADQALMYFGSVRNVTALKVSDLLNSLYTFEHTSRRFPAWTLSIVDIEGVALHTNPLSKDVVSSLLRKFGDPRLFAYHVGQSSINHVQALFSSMAEALGASIANGSWYHKGVLESPRFRYRVRLVGSDKEREILTFSNNPNIALELDYFIGSDLCDIPAPISPVTENPPFYLPGNGYRNPPREYPRSRSYLDRNPQGQNRGRQPNYRQSRTYARSRGAHPQSQPSVPQDQTSANPPN